VVLFDVGGVLVELSGVATLLGWLDHRLTIQQLWSHWLHSPSVRAFETGRIDERQFAAGMLAELRLFASHLMGKIKPDAEAFEHVLESLDCQASQVLFLDDNGLNIEAARSIGMRAQLVRGADQAQLSLQQPGIITAC
jgi:beta-phosphoglucomutase-like phosphatase (HAD superfamily)